MKNTSNIINVILIIAVGILFYLHFADKKQVEKKPNLPVANVANKSNNNMSIAYFDLDSLNENISYIKNNRKQMESEQQAIENEWENAYRNLEKQKNDFLKRGASITQSEAEVFQNKLLQQQEEVDTKKQNASQRLNQRSYKFSEELQQKLKKFLEDYNKDKVYNYIFTVGTGLDYLIYKDSSMNITKDVIDGMNEILKTDSK
jgi:outer membrane protein